MCGYVWYVHSRACSVTCGEGALVGRCLLVLRTELPIYFSVWAYTANPWHRVEEVVCMNGAFGGKVPCACLSLVLLLMYCCRAASSPCYMVCVSFVAVVQQDYHGVA